MFELIVVEPFGGYPKGHVISDPQMVAKIKNDIAAHHYVQRQKAPDADAKKD